MRLRSKTLLTVAAILVVMTVVIVTIVTQVILTNALTAEREAINTDLDRASSSIELLNEVMAANVKDWAPWDATYDYVRGLYPSYIEENLPNSTLVNLDLDLVLFYNSSMVLLSHVSYDHMNEQELEFSSAALSSVGQMVQSMQAQNPREGRGLMILEDRILMLAYNEIVDTSGTKPPMGTMVMARIIDNETMLDISDKIKVTTFLFPIDGPESTNLDPSHWYDVVHNGVIGYMATTPNMTASKALSGMDGAPVAILQVQISRDIYNRAVDSVSVASTALILVVLGFLAVSLLVTDLFTLRRIDRLSKQVVEIGKKGKETNRVVMNGSDELADLAREVNRTLDAVASAERSLLESEKRYRAIVNDQSELIFRIKPDGTITFANDAMLRELKQEGKDIVGLRADQVLPPVLNDALIEQSKEAAQIQGPVTKDIRYIFKRDGREKWYSISLRAITSDNGLQEFQGVVRDLTEVKMAEMALIEANKKLNLLASISRQNVMGQLTVAQGFVSIAITEEKDPRTLEHLKKSEAALRAIQGHLEFTRDYQRTGMVIPVWIGLRDSVEKAAEDVRAKGIAVSVDVSDFEILADPLAEKVFYNLLENSVMHGQTVTAIRVSAREAGQELVVTFEDDGIGVASINKERIFQADAAKGSSYGLFLAREILSSAGITIKETGLEGRGARFEIIFPPGRFRHSPPRSAYHAA